MDNNWLYNEYVYHLDISKGDYRDMIFTSQSNNSILKRILLAALTITLIAFLCSCGVDTVAVAGNVSQVTEKQDAEADPQDQEESSEDFLADIPEWRGLAFCYVNGNEPDFEDDEIWTSTQESLDPLDTLGRCGSADSCIGTDGMPTEPRGDISSVEPTGWQTDTYNFVEGELLFNRCHLIGHQLSGDDAIPRNLITGTSYMNREGMLQFENAIAAYVKGTGNHVMYRVTPVFVGEELIARGVHMEAVSVEDEGEGLAFNVFCYNAQPGVDIDYETGDNKLSEDTTMLEDYQYGKFAMGANTLGVIPSEEEGTVSDESAGDEQVQTYVLNTNKSRMRFHYPNCRSVETIKDKNKKVVEATRSELLAEGYTACGNCKP